MQSFHEWIFLEDEDYNIFLSHFLYPDLAGSTKFFPGKVKEFRPHLKLMAKKKCLIGIVGHAHLQGYSITTRKQLRYNYFGKIKLERVPQVIITPAITRGDSKNGVLMVDTKIPELEAIPI